jgi:predicted alpha-1,2-mannosidase
MFLQRRFVSSGARAVAAAMMLGGLVGAGRAAPADMVNPFIGTGRAGNTYPGAQAPFGMISWSPSTTFEDYESGYSRPGYKYDRTEIYGFALTHISGVGCHAAQDLPIMPVLGGLPISPVKNRDAYKARFSKSREEARPGFYRVYLDGAAADVQLAVSERAGLGRFTFNRAGDRSVLFRPTESMNNLRAAFIQIDAARRQVSGWMMSGGFCSRNPVDNSYRLYFHAEFNQRITAHGFWREAEKQPGVDELDGADIGAYVTFDPAEPVVEMRIGLSYVSEADAKMNLVAEIPDWNQAALRERTTTRWNELLGRVEIDASAQVQTAVYTALYHNLLQPSLFDDVNGEYLGFDDRIHRMTPGRHKYVNFSNWDTYRTSAPLQGLLYSREAADMATSLLLDLQQGAPKGFPNWGYFNHDAGIMNGYSGVPFVVNAWAFGARDLDEPTMREALVKAADTDYERGAAYISHGYVPSFDGPWNFCASMTLEYAIADFCVSRFCQAAGDGAGAKRFLARAQNVFNLLDPGTRYLRPRLADGSWLKPFAVTQETGFNEGNSSQYTWSTPQNMARLIGEIGGPAATEKRLDAFLSKILVEGWNTTEPYFWPANEPCFGVPYIYCWIGLPWKTQGATARIRQIFAATPDGIPGDDDVGAMSAYYVFNVLGLYPAIPGVGGFAISSPAMTRARLHLGNGKTLTLQAPGADAGKRYIHQLMLNGRPWASSWIYLDALCRGRENELRFDLRGEPDKTWGSTRESLPPSFPEPPP